MLTAIVSIITFVYLLGTSVIVLQKNPFKAMNVSLATAVIFIGLWLIGVAGLTTSLGTDELYGRIIFAVAAVGIEALFLFILFFARSENKALQWLNRPVLSIVFAGIIVALSFSPYVVQDVVKALPGDLPTPVYGNLYKLYLGCVVFIATLAGMQLLYMYAKSTGRLRAQTQVMLVGFFFFMMVALTTNVAVPLLAKSSDAAKLTPLSAIILATALSYAALKHRLFDIHWFVVRASAYTISTVLLGVLYLGPVLFVMIIVLGFPFVPIKFFVALIVAMIAASFYGPIRQWFSQRTNKIFFHEVYNPELFISDLNKSVVSNLNLISMLNGAAEVIVTNMKVEYCTFALINRGEKRIRYAGSMLKSFETDRILAVDTLMQKMESRVVASDEFSAESNKLYRELRDNNIAAIGRLVETTGAGKHSFGYVILGPKKSGVIFTKQDIRMLETIIDGLFVAIQNAVHFEEIQNFNVTLQRRIEEATAQLRRTNAKLRALDETKDDFISMASHQLRTPLTSVKGYLSMVLEGDAGDIAPKQRKMLDQAFISSQRMVFLIADLLNVSRLKTGKFVIEPSPINLAKTISDEVSQLKETAKDRSLELIYDKPADFPIVMMDETKIRQVVMNFIDNAIYYTPAGGKIHVQLLNNPNTIELRISDNGIGVPKREQPHLFTKFYRAGNARQARPDGTGLGLFMAKKVILAQGGAVIFESQEGKGSTFGFTFSKHKLVAPPAPQAQALHH
jgi:signal transduction histidine kinase